MKKLSERDSTEDRLRSVDWLIGRLFQLKAQLAAGEWPPDFNQEK